MEKRTPKYSFVLPAYKGAHLGESITSILCQSYTDFELIIVDDCSVDNIESIVASYSDSRVEYYCNEENIGGVNLVRQWNLCLEKARGSFVILASDDDVYESDYLTKMDMLVNAFPYVDVFRPLICHVDENGEKTICEEVSFSHPTVITQEKYLELFANKQLFSGLQQYLFRREALMEIGGFVDLPRAWFSDDATVIRLSHDNGLAVYPDVLFKFRIWSGSISGERFSYKSACRKMDAAVMFSRYLDKYAIADIRVVDRIKYRAKYLTFQQYSSGSFWELVRGCFHMMTGGRELFTPLWVALMFCSTIKKRLSIE